VFVFGKSQFGTLRDERQGPWWGLRMFYQVVNIWIVQNSALDYDIHRPNLGLSDTCSASPRLGSEYISLL